MPLAITRMRFVLLGVMSIFVFVFTSNSASATCGDYVHIQGSFKNSMNANGSMDHSTPALPCPCRGSSCQQNQDPSVPSPIPPSTVQSQATDAILTLDEDRILNAITIQRIENEMDFLHLTQLIFHPPRTSC